MRTQMALAGPTLPALSSARTSSEWRPSASTEMFRLVELFDTGDQSPPAQRTS